MDHKRLLWGSRRGMLELDLVLQPFVENVYPDLEEADQLLYQRLLEEQDQDMFSWFIHKENPQDIDLLRIVNIIREHTRKRHST